MGSVERYETKAGARYLVRYRKPDHSQGKRRGFARKRDADLFLASVETAKARGEHGFGAHWAGQGAPLARPMDAAALVRTLACEWREAGGGS